MNRNRGRYTSTGGITYYYDAVDFGRRVQVEFVPQHDEVVMHLLLRKSAEMQVEAIDVASRAIEGNL